MVCVPVRLIIPSLKLEDYLTLQAHKLIYDTSSNDTSSTVPFRRNILCSPGRHIVSADFMYHVIVRLRTRG